jgi:hypothetical protein
MGQAVGLDSDSLSQSGQSDETVLQSLLLTTPIVCTFSSPRPVGQPGYILSVYIDEGIDRLSYEATEVKILYRQVIRRQIPVKTLLSQECLFLI